MSWRTVDLREGILGLFAEAQRFAIRIHEINVAKLEAFAQHRREKSLALYHQDKRRKEQVLARGKTEESRFARHARYLRDKEAGFTSKRKPRCSMSPEERRKERERGKRYRDRQREARRASVQV